jgi:hypothetical protein
MNIDNFIHRITIVSMGLVKLAETMGGDVLRRFLLVLPILILLAACSGESTHVRQGSVEDLFLELDATVFPYPHVPDPETARIYLRRDPSDYGNPDFKPGDPPPPFVGYEVRYTIDDAEYVVRCMPYDPIEGIPRVGYPFCTEEEGEGIRIRRYFSAQDNTDMRLQWIGATRNDLLCSVTIEEVRSLDPRVPKVPRDSPFPYPDLKASKALLLEIFGDDGKGENIL